MNEIEAIAPAEEASCPSLNLLSRVQKLGSGVVSILLVLVTLAVFWPVTGHKFITFDDPVYITANPHVQSGLNGPSVRWAFRNLEAGFWHPLTWISIMADYQMYGHRAGGHHLTSLLLHAASTVLLFSVFRRMTGAKWRSAFVAALFALHPLHVESVVWAAERKDVLSTFFVLLAVWAYTGYAVAARAETDPASLQTSTPISAGGNFGWYFLALGFFACALMSKTMVVTLPLVLLLLDFWPLQRLEKSGPKWNLKSLGTLLLEKMPFFAFSLFAGLLTLRAEHAAGALQDASQFPLPSRLANALLSCWRYLGQMLWPGKLAVFYPYPTGFSAWQVTAAALCLLLVTVLALTRLRSKPYLAMGWFWYLVTLLPVVGLIQVGAHAHADRYTYIPLIGIFAVITWGMYDLTRDWKIQSAALSFAGVVILGCCVGFTWRQVGYWRDSETLFQHALRVTRHNFIAYNNLGTALAARGKLDEAATQFRESIRSQPLYSNAHGNLGQVLALQGRFSDAVVEFQESLRLKSGDARIQSNLGDVLGAQGKYEQAILCYREALRLNPDLPGIHQTLGMALAHQGMSEEAIDHYTAALRADPRDATMHDKLGIELTRKGKIDEGIGHFREAARIDPNSPGIHSNLGKALSTQNKLKEAIAEYQLSLRLNPEDAVVHNNLGVALARSGQLDAAIKHFQDAIRINPNYASAHGNLGKALAAHHQFDAAVAEYQQSLRLAPDDAAVQKNLANVLARRELEKLNGPDEPRSP